MVARPPIDAAYAIDMTRHSEKALWVSVISSRPTPALGRIVAIIAIAIGIIIIAVAVLEIHIERKAVATINPKTSILGDVPTFLII